MLFARSTQTLLLIPLFISLLSAAGNHTDVEIFSVPSKCPEQSVSQVQQIVGVFPTTGQKFVAHTATLCDASRLRFFPQPGGCGPANPGPRTLVTESAQIYGCEFATNGAFFNMDTGECETDLVSNGTVEFVSTAVGPSLGTSSFGSWVVGYLSTADLSSNRFGLTEALQGSGWLVRNGVNYINASAAAEGISSDSMREEAPRTVVGLFPNASLVWIVVDGQEDIDRGANMWELAELMMMLGLREAVNIDGGGSSVAVYDSAIVSTPTCMDNSTICQRAVATITCAVDASSLKS